MTTCPSCDGTGRSRVLARTTGGCRTISLPCPLCQQTGQVSLQTLAQLAAADRLRQAREAVWISQREAANFLHTDLDAYTQYEQGSLGPLSAIETLIRRLQDLRPRRTDHA